VVQSLGGSTLYEIPTSGYFQVVDRVGSIAADRVDINAATNDFRSSDQATRNIYPGVAFDGAKPAPDTVVGTPDTVPGSVLNQSNRRENGLFEASVFANRAAVVVLKATYDPGWRVTVDGKRAHTVMMAPSIVGVEVGPGQHQIRFSYRAYGHYPSLLTIGALTLLALGMWPERRRWIARGQRTLAKLRKN
jgi:hypothetical protein